MLDRRRLLGLPLSGKLVAWCIVLTLEVALLRLVYPTAVVLVEQAWAGSALGSGARGALSPKRRLAESDVVDGSATARWR